MKMLKTLGKVLATGTVLALDSNGRRPGRQDRRGRRQGRRSFWNKIKKGMDDACLAVVANGGSCNYLRLADLRQSGC